MGRIQAKANLAASATDAAKADGLVLPASITTPANMGFAKTNHSGFQRAFLTCMIFSCLIDADRTAAAAFEARSGHREVPETAASPSIVDWMMRYGLGSDGGRRSRARSIGCAVRC